MDLMEGVDAVSLTAGRMDDIRLWGPEWRRLKFKAREISPEVFSIIQNLLVQQNFYVPDMESTIWIESSPSIYSSNKLIQWNNCFGLDYFCLAIDFEIAVGSVTYHQPWKILA